MSKINDPLVSNFDLRMRERLLVLETVSVETQQKKIDSLPDLTGQTVPTRLVQPAIGLFSEERLAEIQAAYPHRIVARVFTYD